MVSCHNAAFSDLINDVTEIYHTDLQMCQRKFRPIKYTRIYSYAKFGTFFVPPGNLTWWFCLTHLHVLKSGVYSSPGFYGRPGV